MKKGVLLLIVILISLPIVYGVTQQFINKHNLNQPNNPVVVAPSGSVSFSVVRSGRTIIGNAAPQVGDVLNFKYDDDVIYNFVRVMHDNLAYYKDYNLQGPSFYGYKDWMQNYAEFSIDTAGFNPGWHHGFIYSTKFNSTTLTYSNMSWKAFSFELQSSLSTPVAPTFPTLAGNTTQFSLVQYIVVDDNASQSDVALAIDIKNNITPKAQSYGFTFENKLDSQVGQKDLDSRLTVVINNGEVIIIIGDNLPAQYVLLAIDIANYIQSRIYPAQLPLRTSVLSSEIKSDNLVAELIRILHPSQKPDLEILYPVFMQNNYVRTFLDTGLTTFQAKIINNGNEDAVFPPSGQTGVKISYYLNNNLIGEDYINDLVLKPGEEYSVDSQVQYDLKNGIYDLKIKIDENNIVDELNEANNEFYYSMIIPTWNINLHSSMKKSMPAPTAQGCIIPVNQMVVTQSIKLCPGKYNLPYGFFLEGDNFELDCNGAVLDGSMSFNQYGQYGGYGISNVDSLNNVKIKNCVIQHYMTGIEINGYNAQNITIEENELVSNRNGIVLVNNQKNSDNKVINNFIAYNFDGIFLGSINNNVVMFNKIIENYVGITLAAAQNNYINSNLIDSSYSYYIIPPATDSNPNPQGIKQRGYGIWMYLFSDINTITNNRVINNEQGGIYIQDSSNNLMQDNDVGMNEDFNILLEQDQTITMPLTAVNNQISENTIYDSKGGIIINALPGDEIRDNNIFGNNIINNQRQVFDSSDYDNYWDDGSLGNYYDDYALSCDDLDNDDVCDKPLSIPGGSNKDNYPSKVLI